jgi:hypothetical protein
MEMSRAPSARFFGYVLGPGEPVAALADLLASVLNQNVTAWRSAPAAVTIERQVAVDRASAGLRGDERQPLWRGLRGKSDGTGDGTRSAVARQRVRCTASRSLRVQRSAHVDP